MVALKLFGSPSILGAEGPITGPATQRLRIALLALLALHGEDGISRDKLIAYLWPELDGERGRHLLSNSLYVLRRALGGDAILAAGDVVRLSPAHVQSDVAEFVAAFQAADHERAARLYSGPLLDGFFLGDAPEFERWLETERDSMSRTYARSLETLAEGKEAEGEFGGAAAWWRRLCSQDPYNSRLALRLMEALERSGDPGGALQHGHLHSTLLREELEIEAGAELLRFMERLRRAPEREPRAAEGARQAAARTPPPPIPVEATAGGATPEGGPVKGDDSLEPSPAWNASHAIRRPFGPRRTSFATFGLLLLIAGGLHAGWRIKGPGAADTSIRSIAVLPLENCTPDPRRSGRPDVEQEYFADGLTDALITELARVPGLRVISRTSVMQYKRECGSRNERPESLREIARELGVDAVVEGTLVRDEQRVRVNAQLIRAATDEHLWADGMEYEREMRDVLALQREMVTSIARSIRSKAGIAGVSDGSAARRADPVAYTLYLKGRYLWNTHQLASYREALDHFLEAAAVDSSFAPAYAGMADVYVHLDEWGGRPEAGVRQKGFRAARRAIQLDEGSSEGHAALAHLLMHAWDWTAAGEAYRRAVQLNPNNGNARILHAFYLSAMERHEDAIAEAVRAVEVDPLSPRAQRYAGYTLYFSRRYDEAVVQWHRVLELDPENPHTHLIIALAHLNAGRAAEGLAWARRGVALAKGAPGARVALARALALAGRSEEAREMLAAVVREVDPNQIDPLDLARAYSQAGDADAAFRWLEIAFAGEHGWLMFLPVEPAYDPLRQDPRFAALLRRLRLDA